MAIEFLALVSALWDSFARAMENDALFTVASLLLAVFIAGFGGKKARGRLAHMAAVMLLCFILGLVLKPLLEVPRPCALGEPSLLPCPLDWGRPSIHASVSFGLALAVLGLEAFPLALLWALLISATRLYLGVHSLPDLAAGLALAVFAMALIDRLGLGERVLNHSNKMQARSQKGGAARQRFLAADAHDEFSRKLVQAVLGLAVVGYAAVVGAEAAALPVALALLCGLLLFHLKHQQARLPMVDALLRWLERPHAAPGYGALTFFAGLLLILTLVPAPLTLPMVLALSVSDALAGLAARWSYSKKSWPALHAPLPHNPSKSWMGTLAFLLSAIPAYALAGWPGVAAVALAAALESLAIGLDDNLLIPWAGVVVAVLMKMA